MNASDPTVVVRADWVVTVDPVDRVVSGGAVAFADGLIVAVGDAQQIVDAHPDAEIVDLPGHALLPGLVNAHTHLAMTMFRGFADDRDLQAFLDVVIPAEIEVLDEDRVRRATQAAAVESLLGGVTTALDMYFFHEAGVLGAAEVGLRLQTGQLLIDPPGPEQLAWDERLRRAEEWLEQRPATPGWRPVLAPHSAYVVSPEHLAAIAELAQRYDAVVHVHASENDGEVELVQSLHGRRPLAVLDDVGLLRSGTVVAHAVCLTDEEIDLLAHTGTAVAHCPASNLKLASGVARVPDVVEAGVPVGIGTDGPASSNDLDMFAALRLAALLHKGAGRNGTGAGAAALPTARALRMATADGAAAVGLAGQVGSLQVGFRADVIAVDLDRPHTQPVYDPVSALVYAAGRSDVTNVWVDGRRVVADTVMQTVDPRTAVADLRALQANVLGR
ncbi:MAG: amidohydrolase family protein [Actinomycetes bacterium]